ncbi:MAG: tRNA 4-thiouridine(8) synthase ThiI [Acidobacteria bacterium]|nr:tRNA 4-thiouridine(8) synthase ThiI [Acidobacteriota bacterium]
MQEYLLRYGELTLKGRNRKLFVQNLIQVLKPRLSVLGGTYQALHKKLLVATDAPQDQVRRILETISGLTSISPIYRTNHDLTSIKALAWQLVSQFRGSGLKFAVKGKRPNKRFPMTSMDMQTVIANDIYQRGFDLPVDLKRPDLTLEFSIEMHDTFMNIVRWPGIGGLPINPRTRFGLLLSGGLDSPVAGYLMQKRGAHLMPIYFHTPPYTVDGAKDKVIDLARVLARYQNHMDLHVVNFTRIMKTLVADCPAECLVILSRRLMMRVATQIMKRHRGHALITGESLGQVASQTIENMAVINEGVPLPILRPVVGMDKVEIIQIARRIGTYEISIQPFEDCCSLFSPKEPVTKASSKRIQAIESNLDIETLVQDAVAGLETITLQPEFE